MAEDKDSDFEIGEVEGFQSNKDQQFSHKGLVMQSMRKCADLGSKEMKEGWFNEKQDKNGNIVRTYIEDTRKAFIESVRTLKMIMACDLDDIAIKRLNKYLSAVKTKERELVSMNNESWERLSNTEKAHYIKFGYKHYSKMISDNTLKQYFVEFELIQWRKVFAELSRLTKRLDFYNAEDFEV